MVPSCRENTERRRPDSDDVIVARYEVPGRETRVPPSQQGRSKVLLGPEIFVLELQVMLSKNRKIFFLESSRPMMLGLVFDVIDGF